MIIRNLRVRIMRALKSLPAADRESPTKPGAIGVVSVHADAGSDDAPFFDAREAEAETVAEAEPFGAWELVDPEEGRAATAAEEEEKEEKEEEDPPMLVEFPARCPPGGDRAVVLYTTTLRGVRRTFEDCNGVRALLECLGVAFQERDVSMDRGLRDELRGLLAAGGEEKAAAVVPPRLFVRGRDLGGAAQVLALHEEGRLVSLLQLTTNHPQQREQQRERQREQHENKCRACGGLRFVVCGECDGSRKVFDGGLGVAARCRCCNENGLVMCPLCS